MTGSGESISLVPRNKSHYFKLDFDYHREESEYYDDRKLFYEYKTIKKYLVKNCPKEFRYLIAIRPNLTGMHVYFWSEKPVLLRRGWKLLQTIKREAGLDPAVEVRPFENTNDRIPFDPEYKVVSDYIRDMDISYAFDILIDEKKFKFISDKTFQRYFDLPDLAGYKREYQKTYIGKLTKSNLDEAYNVRMYHSLGKHKNRYWYHHCEFLHGAEKHSQDFTLQEFLRDLMVFTVHLYDKGILINHIVDLLENVDRKRTVSSYFHLSTYQKKYKYIEDYYNRVIRQKGFYDIVRSEMIVERVLERFLETGRDLLCPKSTQNYKEYKATVPDLDLRNDEIHSFVLSNQEKDQIDPVLTPLLPKNMKQNAYRLALLLPKFANMQNSAGLGIAYSYWNKFLKTNFGWTAGKNVELKRILDALVSIHFLKRCSTATNGSFNYDVGKNYPCREVVAVNNQEEMVQFSSRPLLLMPEVEDYESQMIRYLSNLNIA